jgi:hypothetical protein
MKNSSKTPEANSKIPVTRTTAALSPFEKGGRGDSNSEAGASTPLGHLEAGRRKLGPRFREREADLSVPNPITKGHRA